MVILITLWILLVIFLHVKKTKQRGSKLERKIAFFHPFCNDAGGGEKVLWSMIEALLQKVPTDTKTQQNKQQQPTINIYSLQGNSQEILTKVKNRFNINLFPFTQKINFIKVEGRWYLTPKSHLTMLCHIFLPMIYCLKCIYKLQPDIFYDTTGFAFNCVLVKLLLPCTQCRVYVHYPFISEDMIKKIRQRRVDYNNNEEISKSKWKTTIILLLYKLVRISIHSVQSNSTWTFNHMRKLWGDKSTKLYPPCSITEMIKYQKNYSGKQYKIISLAQFRPQKNHILQINVIKNLVKRFKNEKKQVNIHLYICGTTRGSDDEKLLVNLKQKVNSQLLNNNIQFCVNMKYTQLLQKLKQCNYAIHSMQSQHFGISIVEMLAAGCLVVAHNSAGPKYDIIKDQRFLAENQQQYQHKIYQVFMMTDQQKKSCSDDFRTRMMEFGEKAFKENFRKIFREDKKQQ